MAALRCTRSREAEDPRSTFIRCLDGERAGPAEDSGGPDRFGEMLFALADSKHPEHQSMREWLGRPFDPREFDVQKLNRVLDRIGRRPATRGSTPRGRRSTRSRGIP